MSFCSFLKEDPHSSTVQLQHHNSSLHNHTTQGLIHFDIRSRCTYTYTPFPSHSPRLQDRLPDRHSSLLLLGNLECWRMDSGLSENEVICSWVDSFLIVRDKDRNYFKFQVEFKMVGFVLNLLIL